MIRLRLCVYMLTSAQYVIRHMPRSENEAETTKKMAAYCLCLTAEGGVPLFCRTQGDLKPVRIVIIILNETGRKWVNCGMILNSGRRQHGRVTRCQHKTPGHCHNDYNRQQPG